MRWLQAAFSACSISHPHTTVDATLCSTLPPAAAFRCTPQATAASSPALATVCEAIDTVSGVETDVSHNVRNCRDGMFITFCAHFVVFFTVHSCLVSSPTHASLRYSAFPTTFKLCFRLAEQNQASLCSRSAHQRKKTISTGCFVCAGCAKAVRVAFSLSCCL